MIPEADCHASQVLMPRDACTWQIRASLSGAPPPLWSSFFQTVLRNL